MINPSNVVKKLDPYVPGKSIDEIAANYGLDPKTIIKLGSNENPIGPSPMAIEALKKNLKLISQYPESNLNSLIKDAMQSIQPLANEKNIITEIKIPNTMFLVQCDADLIMQVLTNLLSNAIKFAPEKGKVTVSVHSNYDELQVWVEDNGKGIDPALHELIFDKFFQAKNQTLRKPEGSGLGLAICKKIIDLHSGTIWVNSELNKGSKFVFTLPIN